MTAAAPKLELALELALARTSACGVRPDSRTHSLVRWDWSAYPAARAASARPPGSGPASTADTNRRKRSTRWRVRGP